MMSFIDSDKEIVKDAYKTILLNLKDYLQIYDIKDELDNLKIIFSMFHNGFFSMNKIINFDDNYEYLRLPLEISQGIQVMYGIYCCRHATEFLYDLLCILNFNPSLMYIWVDNDTGIWRKVNPAIEKANHQVILLNNEEKYIIDIANKLILQIQKNGELRSLNSEYFDNIKFYKEDNITIVAKVLKKYYTYKELGIKCC